MKKLLLSLLMLVSVAYGQQLPSDDQQAVDTITALLSAKESTISTLTGQNSTLTTENQTLASEVVALQSQLDALNGSGVFGGLEQTAWLVASGAAADTGATGNVPVASQSQPSTTTAWFAIDPQTKAYANAYFYKKLGADASKTSFKYALRLMCATAAECAASQAVELDVQQVIGGVVYNTGAQWDFADGQFRVWNRSGHAWVATGIVATRWTPGQWMSVVLETHRTDTTVVYDAITVNGVRTALTQSYPAPNLGLTPMLNCAVQLDGNKTGAPYHIYVDAVSMTTHP